MKKNASDQQYCDEWFVWH